MTVVEEIQLALCLKEKECPECKGTGLSHLQVLVYESGDKDVLCLTCNGIRKVPLLQGVREKCPCDTPQGHQGNHCENCGWSKTAFIHDPDCEKCRGRGWVPSTDPWKWFETIENIFMEDPFGYRNLWLQWQNIKSHVPDGPLVFLRSSQALAKALEVEDV